MRLPQFSVEYGIIGPLYLAGLNCRGPGVRRQVLELLSTPRREGMWDSQVIAFILERIIAQEEAEKLPVQTGSDGSAPTSLREIVERARKEMLTLGSSGRQMRVRVGSMGTEAESAFISCETLVSLEPIIERPYTLQFRSESPPEQSYQ